MLFIKIELVMTNPCSTHPCLNNGTCFDETNSAGMDLKLVNALDFRCFCPIGYSGIICQGMNNSGTPPFPETCVLKAVIQIVLEFNSTVQYSTKLVSNSRLHKQQVAARSSRFKHACTLAAI